MFDLAEEMKKCFSCYPRIFLFWYLTLLLGHKIMLMYWQKYVKDGTDNTPTESKNNAHRERLAPSRR